MYDWSGPNKPSVRLFIDADCGVSGTVAGLQHWDDGGQAAKELLAAYPHGVFPREWADEIGRQVRGERWVGGWVCVIKMDIWPPSAFSALLAARIACEGYRPKRTPM